MGAGNQGEGLVHVGPKLVGRAGPSRIVAGDRQAPADILAGILEAADIVALPAVQRDRNLGQTLEGPVHVHAEGRIPFLRQREGLFHVLERRGHDAILMENADQGSAMCGFSHGRMTRSSGCCRSFLRSRARPTKGSRLRAIPRPIGGREQPASAPRSDPPAGNAERSISMVGDAPRSTSPPGRRCRRPRSSPESKKTWSRTRPCRGRKGARTLLQTSSCLTRSYSKRRAAQVQHQGIGLRRAEDPPRSRTGRPSGRGAGCRRVPA